MGNKQTKKWYAYIAVFEHAEDGINITFPDLPECFTCADTDQEGIRMARSVLGLHLSYLEDHGKPIPEPSKIEDIETEVNQIPCLIDVFMPEARADIREVFVKKTLTLPSGLAARAEKVCVNFSKVLREALEDYLGEDES